LTKSRTRPPPHPGKVLLEEFLKPLGLTQTALAEHIDEYLPILNMIIQGKRRVTPTNAWKLGYAFGTGPRYWMDLQSDRDLWEARLRRKPSKVRKRRASSKSRKAERRRAS
jgi:addiction module HigA family antidote